MVYSSCGKNCILFQKYTFIMSELDFEEEITTEASLHRESTIDVEQKIEMNDGLSSVEDPNKDILQVTSKTIAEPEMSDGEIVESDSGKLSDLEEGEINDPSVPSNNICRYFLRGTCQYGYQCRFAHTRGSAYSMFETKSAKRIVYFVPKPSFSYPAKSDFRDSHSTAHEGDNWDKALQEAKELMLNARDRKVTDIEFEKKKLYLSCKEDGIEKDGKARSLENRNKYKQSSFALKSNGHKYAEKETRLKRDEFHSKHHVRPQNWVDPWRRSRSRTRRSSSFSSRSSSHHSCRDSSSSARSLSGSPKKSCKEKLKTKFNRKYSRSRSCSLPYSSRSRSYSREKSSSLSTSRSRSRSSSASRFSKIYSDVYLPTKSGNLSSNARHPSKRRKLESPSSLSAEIKLKDPSNLRWEMDSSDITVSCISCTSLSCSDASGVSDNDSVSKRVTSNHDKKLSNHLKKTQNDDKTSSHSSKKNKSSEQCYAGYKHHSDAKYTAGEVPNKYHKSNELSDTVACTPKLIPSNNQDYSVRKNINLNLKSNDKSSSVFEKQPVSRREQLLKQLEAVELAIAKKKQL